MSLTAFVLYGLTLPLKYLMNLMLSEIVCILLKRNFHDFYTLWCYCIFILLVFDKFLESNRHLTLKRVSVIYDDLICPNYSWILIFYCSCVFTLSVCALLFYIFSLCLLYCNTSTLILIFLRCDYSWIFRIFGLHKFCHLDLLLVLVSVDEAGHVGNANICVWRGVNCRYLTMNLQVKWRHRHRNSWYVGQRAPPASWVLCPIQTLWTLQNLTFLLFLRCVLLHILKIIHYIIIRYSCHYLLLFLYSILRIQITVFSIAQDTFSF